MQEMTVERGVREAEVEEEEGVKAVMVKLHEGFQMQELRK
jgi:hypothetical protein